MAEKSTDLSRLQTEAEESYEGPLASFSPMENQGRVGQEKGKETGA